MKVVQSEAEIPEVVKDIRGGLKIYTLPFALVEYDEASAASHASKSLTNKSDWRRGIRVEVLAKFTTKVVSKDKENKMNANIGNYALFYFGFLTDFFGVNYKFFF